MQRTRMGNKASASDDIRRQLSPNPRKDSQGRREKVPVPTKPGKVQKGVGSQGWSKKGLRESWGLPAGQAPHPRREVREIAILRTCTVTLTIQQAHYSDGLCRAVLPSCMKPSRVHQMCNRHLRYQKKCLESYSLQPASQVTEDAASIDK